MITRQRKLPIRATAYLSIADQDLFRAAVRNYAHATVMLMESRGSETPPAEVAHDRALEALVHAVDSYTAQQILTAISGRVDIPGPIPAGAPTHMFIEGAALQMEWPAAPIQ